MLHLCCVVSTPIIVSNDTQDANSDCTIFIVYYKSCLSTRGTKPSNDCYLGKLGLQPRRDRPFQPVSLVPLTYTFEP